MKNYLNQNVGEETKDYLLEKEERHYNITFVATGNKYIVLEDGTVLTQEEYDNKFKAGFKDTIVVEVGEHKSVSVDTETDSTINWKCDNEKIAKINVNISNIKEVDILGVANGKTTITAKLPNGEKWAFEILVQTSPESITLNKTNETLDLNGTSTVQLVATINPGTANVNRDITWSSSDSSKVKVDSNGNTATITALSNTATNSPVKITATAQNGNMAQCLVIVKTSLTGLTVSPTSKTLASGQTVTLTATKTPSSATEGLTWSSGNTSVATVSSSGVVTAKSAGTTTITVKGSSSNVYASCTITVCIYMQELDQIMIQQLIMDK